MVQETGHRAGFIKAVSLPEITLLAKRIAPPSACVVTSGAGRRITAAIAPRLVKGKPRPCGWAKLFALITMEGKLQNSRTLPQPIK